VKPAEHLAEALFQLRSLSGLGKLCLKPSARPYLEDADREVVIALAALGYDAGSTAVDADALKLQLMGRAVPEGYGGDAGPAEGRLELALQELADRFGDGNVFRQLERFTLFCSQMRFSFVPDDKLLPVYPWCRAEGRQPAGDLAEAVQLFEQWQEAAAAQFRGLMAVD